MAANYQRPANQNWDAAWHIFLAGATHEETAEISGIPHQEIINYSAAHSWMKRRQISREFAHKAITQDLARKLEKARVRHQSFMVDQLYETQSHIEQIAIGPNEEEGQVHVMDKLAVLTCQHNLASRVLSLDKQTEQDPNELGFAMLVAMSRTSPNSLVNEKQQQTYDLNSTEVTLLNEPIPLPPPSPPTTDPLAGILRPFNGHINGPTIPPNTTQSEVKQPEGPTGPQQTPYQAPIPLVNENSNGDQATDPTTNTGTEGEEGQAKE